jgi:hypothetical protein
MDLVAVVFTVSEAGTSKLKVLANLVSGEGSLPDSRMLSS